MDLVLSHSLKSGKDQISLKVIKPENYLLHNYKKKGKIYYCAKINAEIPES